MQSFSHENCVPGISADASDFERLDFDTQLDRQTSVAGKMGNGCEIEFLEPLPSLVKVGQTFGSLIDMRQELKDVVFLARPADAKPNSVAPIFVLEPGTDFARRATVRYGRGPARDAGAGGGFCGGAGGEAVGELRGWRWSRASSSKCNLIVMT